jgi:hypothetical protein
MGEDSEVYIEALKMLELKDSATNDEVKRKNK